MKQTSSLSNEKEKVLRDEHFRASRKPRKAFFVRCHHMKSLVYIHRRQLSSVEGKCNGIPGQRRDCTNARTRTTTAWLQQARLRQASQCPWCVRVACRLRRSQASDDSRAKCFWLAGRHHQLTLLDP